MIDAPCFLRIENVLAGYGRQAVLRDLQIEIRRGSFTSLLGPNGSGKTTLLKIILGILPPLRGRITFAPVEGRPPVLGYVPQRESLDPDYPLSSADVVQMGAYGRVGPGRFLPQSEKEHALECLRLAGAAAISDQPFAQLSGGQKQRVLIARALAVKPDFLALDEPTAGIDESAAEAVMQLLASLNRERGITILMVNHDLRTVRRHTRETIWLQNGTAVQGSVEDLLERSRMEDLLR